jgi:hypothetical protein
MLKRWFNARWHYHRLCLMPWCVRGQVYDNVCYRHTHNEMVRRLLGDIRRETRWLQKRPFSDQYDGTGYDSDATSDTRTDDMRRERG